MGPPLLGSPLPSGGLNTEPATCNNTERRWQIAMPHLPATFGMPADTYVHSAVKLINSVGLELKS